MMTITLPKWYEYESIIANGKTRCSSIIELPNRKKKGNHEPRPTGSKVLCGSARLRYRLLLIGCLCFFNFFIRPTTIVISAAVYTSRSVVGTASYVEVETTTAPQSTSLHVVVVVVAVFCCYCFGARTRALLVYGTAPRIRRQNTSEHRQAADVTPHGAGDGRGEKK